MFAVELIGTSQDFESVPIYEKYVSTIPAVVTMFQVMTLDEWRSITQPLMDHRWWAKLFFVLYICVSSLAMMNLITAVIVENALQSVSKDDELKQKELEVKQKT